MSIIISIGDRNPSELTERIPQQPTPAIKGGKSCMNRVPSDLKRLTCIRVKGSVADLVLIDTSE
jgi:hypothetical protein